MRIPCENLSVCASKFLYPLSKDSQWETAKAGYKNADNSLYGASHKTCFDVMPQVLKKHRCSVFVFGIML